MVNPSSLAISKYLVSVALKTQTAKPSAPGGFAFVPYERAVPPPWTHGNGRACRTGSRAAVSTSSHLPFRGRDAPVRLRKNRACRGAVNCDLLITPSLTAWRDLEGCIVTEHQRGRSWLNERRDQKYKSAPNCEEETLLNAVRQPRWRSLRKRRSEPSPGPSPSARQ